MKIGRSVSSLKVFHFSTFESFGGAAIAARRVHESMHAHGIDSTLLVRFAKNNVTGVVQLEAEKCLWKKGERVLRRNLLSLKKARLPRSSSKFSRIAGGLTDPRADLLVDFSQLPTEPDIIHLHKVEGFIDFKNFVSSVPSHIPIVVTLHDLSAVTGGCDYPQNCGRFAQECGKCPVIGSEKSSDFSRIVHRLKQTALCNGKQIGFIANSDWTAKEARRSSIVGSKPVSTIYFGIDTTVFHARDRENAKQSLGFSKERRLLLFGATDAQNARKGGEFLRSFVDEFKDVDIVSFGAKPITRLGANYSHLGSIECEKIQNLVFRAADVFLMPSVEEAFGLTAQEAISSGTVVAAFAAGGIPEIVVNGLNGTLVPNGDIPALVAETKQLLANEDLRHNWAENATDWCNRKFNVNKMVDHHISFYRSLLALA